MWSAEDLTNAISDDRDGRGSVRKNSVKSRYVYKKPRTSNAALRILKLQASVAQEAKH
ncbi:unnamed protein product [Acanthoscelides obtectus]|uniref:Uncharacterized protein n=1 Tax=Acanthoscelides obtectus TaxID=200917 RepID=A0A9P0KFN8_ACAOB|nr:unnamed protein product [Acanthoscelides obtectus]CAK1667523.1 hypothetical protein AOBTE_LOCUS25889 [Acanthoscelides obtectus]